MDEKISVVVAKESDKELISNFCQFYLYEMSLYLDKKTLPMEKGRYCEVIGLKRYWEEEDRHPFLVYFEEEVVGFALVYKPEATGVDWFLAEFFIRKPFQGRGIGMYAANLLFNRFPGVWELGVIPENRAALAFWSRVVGARIAPRAFTSALRELGPNCDRLILTFGERP